MAKAFCCDRCNAYEDGEPVAGVTFLMPNPESTNAARKNVQYELCAPCLASLKEWIEDHG